jgi:hypothetical protein
MVVPVKDKKGETRCSGEQQPIRDRTGRAHNVVQRRLLVFLETILICVRNKPSQGIGLESHSNNRASRMLKAYNLSTFWELKNMILKAEIQ